MHSSASFFEQDVSEPVAIVIAVDAGISVRRACGRTVNCSKGQRHFSTSIPEYIQPYSGTHPVFEAVTTQSLLRDHL